MVKLERIGNYIVLTDLVSGHRDDYPADDLYFRWEQNTISFNHKFNRSLIHQYQFSELVDKYFEIAQSRKNPIWAVSL